MKVLLGVPFQHSATPHRGCFEELVYRSMENFARVGTL